MRTVLKDLMDHLSVGYELSAYENCMWSVYDDEKGITCNAEVRMSPDADIVEAELQLLYDIPPAGKPPVEQAFYGSFHISPKGDKWDAKIIKVKGEGKESKKYKELYNFEQKACKLFDLCAQEIKMGKFPDIDEIWEKVLAEKDRMSDQYGGGSSKAPKIQANQLLNPKTGM